MPYEHYLKELVTFSLEKGTLQVTDMSDSGGWSWHFLNGELIFMETAKASKVIYFTFASLTCLQP